jgi:putative addiction module antidote
MERAMVTLKLTSVGTSTGAVIPKEMLSRMKVAKGGTLFAVETPSGYLLTPYDPAVEQELALGREFMAEYRDTFRALAK